MFQLHVYPSYSLFVVPQLLLRPKFSAVEKIKTIGSTYMAASGLSPGNQVHTCKEICTWCISVWYLVLQGRDDWRFLYLLVEFAFQLQSRLEQINKHSFQTFSLRIGVVIRITELEYHHLRFMVIVLGITHGPLVAGVIGARKPQYDIWGNTVNMASRMESTGTFGKIQVPKDTAAILSLNGFEVEERGMVKVKGKGEVLTSYVTASRKKTGSSTASDKIVPVI
jgi:class 3 adenylate cyclase